MSKGHNNPPAVELTAEEAQVVFDTLDRDIQQSLQLLLLVQAGKIRESSAEKVVAYTEKIRPIHKKLKRSRL